MNGLMNGLLVVLGALALLALLAMVAPAMAAGLKDASLKLTLALPASNTTVYATPGLDTGNIGGNHPGGVEFLLTAPALTTAQLGDAATMKYSILYDSVNPIDASSTVLHADIITQTDAGGAGAAGATKRFKLPSTAGRILGFKVVNSANADASAASATLEALF